jgi:hypothetical protein
MRNKPSKSRFCFILVLSVFCWSLGVMEYMYVMKFSFFYGDNLARHNKLDRSHFSNAGAAFHQHLKITHIFILAYYPDWQSFETNFRNFINFKGSF